MPRYSYVIVFPVLVALCIGINIQRYPAVSAMLKGETVESRWLGRSDIFNFNTNKAEAATYQGYHSDADTVADSRSAREPIPLSDSRSTASSTSSTDRSSTNRSVDATPSRYTSRYSSSYGSESTPTPSNSSTNAASSGTSNDSSSSYFGGGSYGGGSYDRSSNSSSTYGSTSDSYGDTGYRSDYGGSSYDASSSRSTSSTSSGTSSSGSSSSSPKNRYNSYDDEDEAESVEEEQDSWSSRYGSAAETSFRSDTPQPGYSSRYAAGDNTTTTSSAETSTAETLPTAISNAASQIVSTVADASTESSEHLTAKTLSVQEKHDLRLLTPFSMTQSSAKDAGSSAYIPPDFLPRNADETADRLQTPSATAAVSISPVTFGTTETTSTPDEDVDAEAAPAD